jgi:peptidoglycan biosynthesis protein MviN/MurJ (putative lipid II flippase)
LVTEADEGGEDERLFAVWAFLLMAHILGIARSVIVANLLGLAAVGAIDVSAHG